MEVTQPAQRIPPRPPGGQRARVCVRVGMGGARVCVRVSVCRCPLPAPPAGDAAVPRAVLPPSVPSCRRAHGSAPQPRNGSVLGSPPPAAAGRAVPGADGQHRSPPAALRGTPAPGPEGGRWRRRRGRDPLPEAPSAPSPPDGLPAPGARGPAAPLRTERRRSPRPVRPPAARPPPGPRRPPRKVTPLTR